MDSIHQGFLFFVALTVGLSLYCVLLQIRLKRMKRQQ